MIKMLPIFLTFLLVAACGPINVNGEDATTETPLSETTVPSETETTQADTVETTLPLPDTTVPPETTQPPIFETTQSLVTETTTVPAAETTILPLEETTQAPAAETTLPPAIETTETTLPPTTPELTQETTVVTTLPPPETTVPKETTQPPMVETTQPLVTETTWVPAAETTLPPTTPGLTQETTVVTTEPPDAETTLTPETTFLPTTGTTQAPNVTETTLPPTTETTQEPPIETTPGPETTLEPATQPPTEIPTTEASTTAKAPTAITTEEIKEPTTAETTVALTTTTAPPLQTVTGKMSAQFVNVSGKAEYWSDDLKNSSSELFASVSTVFLSQLETIYRTANVSYSNVTVTSFSQGSLSASRMWRADEKYGIDASYQSIVIGSITEQQLRKDVDAAINSLGDTMATTFGKLTVTSNIPQPPQPSDPGLSSGVLAAIIVSSVVGALLILLALYGIYRSCRKISDLEEQNPGVPASNNYASYGTKKDDELVMTPVPSMPVYSQPPPFSMTGYYVPQSGTGSKRDEDGNSVEEF